MIQLSQLRILLSCLAIYAIYYYRCELYSTQELRPYSTASYALDLLTTPTFVLTLNTTQPRFAKRLDTILASLKKSGFQDVEPVYGLYNPENTEYGVAFGHSLIIERALQRKPFKPFLILEDDAMHDHILNPSILIPKNADALHLSTCKYSVNITSSEVLMGGTYFSRTSTQNIRRVYGMLSAHAVLILNEQFARHWQRCAVDSCARKEPIDVLVGLTHHLYRVYAQRIPIFWQDAKMEGREDETRFRLSGMPIPDLDEQDVMGWKGVKMTRTSGIAAAMLKGGTW